MLGDSPARLTLGAGPAWRPDLRITPVTSTTMEVVVRDVPPSLTVSVQLYPSADPARPRVTLAPQGGQYRGELRSNPDQPAFEGHLLVRVESPQSGATLFEQVEDFTIGGNPGRKWATRAPRGNPGRKWATRAPVISNDGQAIIYTPALPLEEGQFFALQASTTLPPPPAWASPIGQSYRLTTSAGVPITGGSISISYLGDDIEASQERGLDLYYHNDAGWQRLANVRRDTLRNEISAPLSGPGLYALMVSAGVELRGGRWNNVPYPGTSAAPADALAAIAGAYTLVYAYDAADPADPWKLYAPQAPAHVNDLAQIEAGRAYWVYATRDVTWLGRPPAAARSAAADPRQADAPTAPPATFYGAVLPGTRYTPAPGQLVEALVGGAVCGQGRTLRAGQAIVYSVAVAGAGPAAAGCGAPGRQVTFRIDGHPVSGAGAWSNTQLHMLDLRPPGDSLPGSVLYLPVIRR